MDSVIPLITSPIRWSITANACSTGRFGTRSSRRLLSRRINESVRSRRRWIPARAFVIRPRSARNGVVARLITTLPAAWASSATWGATPVPVPPPSPTVMKVMSASPIWFRSSCSEISALRSRDRGSRVPATVLFVDPFHGLVEPASDVLADRISDRVLDGNGVARLHELLKVHHVPLRQFDHELADVIQRELDVDETIDRRADRVGDRRVRSALHELVEGLHFVRRQPDRDPLRFG